MQGLEARSRKKVVDEPAQPAVVLTSDLDSLAYCYGMMFGNQYSNFADSGVVVPDVKMNMDLFLKAFEPAMRRDSAALLISIDQAQEFMQNFMGNLQQRMEEKRLAELAENKRMGAEYMAANGQKPGVQTLESGLQIEVLTEGEGKAPGSNSQVRMKYKGMLTDGTVFDESDDAILEADRVISGFGEAILLMKEGGKLIATIPSDLAYGDRGAGPMITGGSTLIFEIELLEVME